MRPSRTRLKKKTRLLAFRPRLISYTLKEKSTLIEVSAWNYVIHAYFHPRQLTSGEYMFTTEWQAEQMQVRQCMILETTAILDSSILANNDSLLLPR